MASDSRQTERELGSLITNLADAVSGIPPWALPRSVLGGVRIARPFRHSEYAMLTSGDVLRTARYLGDVIVPSLNQRAPRWMPPGLRRAFFHETRIQRRPDEHGNYDSFADERWFFINGILTNGAMAAWNADYLARMFGRPFTIIQNATDGPVSDLLECAVEKAFGMNGEPVDVGFPELHRALKDRSRDRIVVIAHSQGTLITAVMVRLLRLLYAPGGRVSGRVSAHDRAALGRAGVTLNTDDFDDITREELERLEIFCFANCANEMRYVDPALELPWIESFGNEHDLVARLGMLAPHLAREEIAIDGPLWVSHGSWGHLLNTHYLAAIDLAQGGSSRPGPVTDSADPYSLMSGHHEMTAPRLYGYLNGGVPD